MSYSNAASATWSATESLDRVLRFRRATGYNDSSATEGFEAKVHEFVSGRLDDLAHSNATLAETFTPETIAFIKDRIDQQVPPIVHHLAEIATSQTTRKQIGGFDKTRSRRVLRTTLALQKDLHFSRTHSPRS